jgi:hypothetical protein
LSRCARAQMEWARRCIWPPIEPFAINGISCLFPVASGPWQLVSGCHKLHSSFTGMERRPSLGSFGLQQKG